MTMNSAAILYEPLPESLRAGVRAWIELGRLPGGFLVAVMTNDLVAACSRADVINRHRLFDIVDWFWNEAPGGCWGSPEKVDAWRDAHEARRRAAKEAP